MKTANKLLISGLTLLGVGATLPAQADPFRDTAWVISSTPVYERYNEPRRECWSEQVGYESVRSGKREYGGAVIGGIVGGLLGNTVGKGSGRSVATAVGAATGAIVGDRIDNDGNVVREYERPRYEERCRVEDNWNQRLTGYNVVYRYNGHDYTAFMPYDPGRTVKVKVNVSLAEKY
ncbi:MAG: glycine zipper 2TM domain-containing protein [Pseudomonadota bacterium]